MIPCCRNACVSPECLMDLSTAQDRAASECPKGLVFVWVPVRASGSHVGVSTPTSARRTLLAPCSLWAHWRPTIVGMMFVECFYMVGILAVCQALALGLQQGGPVVSGKQQRHIFRLWSQHLGRTRRSGEGLSDTGH